LAPGRECRSRVNVCVVRTGGRPSARADAGTIKPRLDAAALPNSPVGASGVALNPIISAFRILRPIQRQALAHKPFAEIGAADRAGRDRSAIWVKAEGRAITWVPGNECIKIVGCLRATTILQSDCACSRYCIRFFDATYSDLQLTKRTVFIDWCGLFGAGLKDC
jgi:hypothetical protein